MAHWANTNGFDWCSNLLLDEHSSKLAIEERISWPWVVLVLFFGAAGDIIAFISPNS